MQAELRTWLQHYVCCAKPHKSNLKWSNSKRKNSKGNRREGSRVTFSKKVNKVEPLYIDNNGILKQRSYISLLSSASEDSIEGELRLFVEKYVNQTVHDAAVKYYREQERELRIKNRAESKYNEMRKFSVIREESEISSTHGSENDTRLSSIEFENESRSQKDDMYDDTRIGNDLDDSQCNDGVFDEIRSFDKEETLSKSNFLENSDEDSLKGRHFVSESDNDSDCNIFDSDSEVSTESEYCDIEKTKDTKLKISNSKSRKIKKTKKTKVKLKQKENSTKATNGKNMKRNKVEPSNQREISGGKGTEYSKGKKEKKRNLVKKSSKQSIKKQVM